MTCRSARAGSGRNHVFPLRAREDDPMPGVQNRSHPTMLPDYPVREGPTREARAIWNAMIERRFAREHGLVLFVKGEGIL